MERKGLLVVTMLTALAVGVTAEGGPPELPPFLPDYYAAALTWEGRPLELLSHAPTSGGERWEYGKGDRSLKLSIEFIDTDDSQNEIALRGLLGFLDAQINAGPVRSGYGRRNPCGCLRADCGPALLRFSFASIRSSLDLFHRRGTS